MVAATSGKNVPAAALHWAAALGSCTGGNRQKSRSEAERSYGAEHSGATLMHLHHVTGDCGVLGLRNQPLTDLSAEERRCTVEDVNDAQRISRDAGPLGTPPRTECRRLLAVSDVRR